MQEWVERACLGGFFCYSLDHTIGKPIGPVYEPRNPQRMEELKPLSMVRKSPLIKY